MISFRSFRCGTLPEFPMISFRRPKNLKDNPVRGKILCNVLNHFRY